VPPHVRGLPVVAPTPSQSGNARAALLAAARAPAPVSFGRPWRAWGLAAGGMLAAAAVLLVIILRPSPRSGDETHATYHATVLPHEGATLLRTSTAPDETVRLINGTATFTVAHLGTGERFRVLTSDAEVEVRGTAFDVTVQDDRLQGVRVVQGQVEVRASGMAPRRLVAGERWEVRLAANDDEGHVTGSVRVSGNDETVGTQPEAEAGTETGSSSPAEIEPRADVVSGIDGTPGWTRVTSGKGQTGKALPARTPATKTSGSVPERDAASLGDSSAPAAITTSTAAAVNAQARPKRQIELLFEQGWADLAAGKAKDAAAAFERAAQAAPDDPLAEDAWFWRASALSRARSSTATGALETFLARYPRSPRVGEASAMLGWLVIERDLDRAERLFRPAGNGRLAAGRAGATKGSAAIARRRRR